MTMWQTTAPTRTFHERDGPPEARPLVPGRTYGADNGSFASFSDPDGNGWLLQEVKTRAPGR
jgi:hypothetical protein